MVIEAYQIQPVDGHTHQVPPQWFINALTSIQIVALDDGGITIKTLEGSMRGDVGDWIIKGVKGEFYPCKPDIFEATYDPA